MMKKVWAGVSVLGLSLSLLACATNPAEDITVTQKSVEPGTSITVKGEAVELYEPTVKLAVGDNLVNALKDTALSFEFTNKVTIISVVLSVDTAVCEAQTHLLGESEAINPGIDRVTISRDLPMAHARFAEAANLSNVTYLSDYKGGTFGKRFGLMMKGKELLARGVIVLDRQGVIKHMQFVPEATHLPDMNKAFAVANSLYTLRE